MARQSWPIAAPAELALAGGLLFTGCAGAASDLAAAGQPSAGPRSAAALSDADAQTIARLAPIAARDAGLTDTPVATQTECWAPSQHLLSELDAGSDVAGTGSVAPAPTGLVDPAERDGFRVICRVHFTEHSAPRYRDMICIGAVSRNPVADSCYQWVYYRGAPQFEDHPGY